MNEMYERLERFRRICWHFSYMLHLKERQNMKYLHEQSQAIFDGKGILITGGSSGIGLVAAQFFAQLGGHVLVVGRRSDDTTSLRRGEGCLFHEGFELCGQWTPV